MKNWESFLTHLLGGLMAVTICGGLIGTTVYVAWRLFKAYVLPELR